MKLRVPLLAGALLVFFSAPHARAAHTIRANGQVCPGSGGAVTTCAFTADNVAGNTIFVVPVATGIGLPNCGITGDTQGNAYNVTATSPTLIPNQFAQLTTEIFYAFNIKAGPNIVSLNCPGGGANFEYILEVSGTDAGNALDGHSAVATAATNPTSTGNITTVNASEFIISVASTVTGGGCGAFPSGWTDAGGGTWTTYKANQNGVFGGTCISMHVATQSASTTGTYFNNITATGLSPNPPTNMVASIASFTIGGNSTKIRHQVGYVKNRVRKPRRFESPFNPDPILFARAAWRREGVAS